MHYNEDSTPVTRWLDGHNIPYRFFRHPGQVTSLEQAALERGQRPDQIVRSIVFRLPNSEYIMVLVAGPRQINWPALRAYLGKSRITLANTEEVLSVTGYPTGAVSPFGLAKPIRILVDRNVLEEEVLSIGSGVHNTTVIIRRADLVKALGDVEVSQFT